MHRLFTTRAPNRLNDCLAPNDKRPCGCKLFRGTCPELENRPHLSSLETFDKSRLTIEGAAALQPRTREGKQGDHGVSMSISVRFECPPADLVRRRSASIPTSCVCSEHPGWQSTAHPPARSCGRPTCQQAAISRCDQPFHRRHASTLVSYHYLSSLSNRRANLE